MLKLKSSTYSDNRRRHLADLFLELISTVMEVILCGVIYVRLQISFLFCGIAIT